MHLQAAVLAFNQIKEDEEVEEEHAVTLEVIKEQANWR